MSVQDLHTGKIPGELRKQVLLGVEAMVLG